MMFKKIKLSLHLVLVLLTFFVLQSTKAQSEIIKTESFNKVIISPHIQVVFRQGDGESVEIESLDVDRNKLNIEVNGNTLRIYLDDAKMITKSKKVDYEEWKGRKPIYQGTVVTAIVTYKNMQDVSLRGEENFQFESLLKLDKLELAIYGESKVTINEIDIRDLKTTIYGECKFYIKKGMIEYQKYVVYGESEIEAYDIENKVTKLTAYGESEFKLNVSERLKITAYGEAHIYYKGNPDVDKGIVIGESTIQSIN